MDAQAPASLSERAVEFFSGWRFPALTLFSLAFFEALVLALLLAPAAPSGLGAFAEDFRIFCFGYDPSRAAQMSSYAASMMAAMLGQFVLFATVVTAVWWAPLKDIVRRAPRKLLPYAAAAFALVGSTGVAFALARGPGGELPFPADRLRTDRTPPSIELTDHEGHRVSLDELRGKVVVITGIYSRCGNTCPMIMGQVRRAVGALSQAEREDVVVLAITLDPEHDDAESLAAMAVVQGVSAPSFHLLTGQPLQVERTLDALEIARRRDPQTGVIDHANVFHVVDRRGRLAYRLALGTRQERWLVEALKILVAE